MFKKGDEVLAFNTYDGKRAVSVERLTVEACGKKILRATRTENGEYIKREIQVRLINAGPTGLYVFPASEVEDVETKAREIAEAVYAFEKDRFARCLRAFDNPSYLAAIKENVAALEASQFRLVQR